MRVRTAPGGGGRRDRSRSSWSDLGARLVSNSFALFVTLTLYALPGLLVGFTLHELAHAAVAVRLGDPTPRRDGRLTLDPLQHIDPIGFALLLGVGFGFAKPVRFNALRLPSRGEQALIAAAGPLTNLALAIGFGVALRLLVNGDPAAISPNGDPFFVDVSDTYLFHGGAQFVLALVLYQAVWVNALLFVFNLIPIPPLDGFAVFKGLANPSLPGLVSWMERNAGMLQMGGFLVLFVLPQLGSNQAGGFIGRASTWVVERAYGGPPPPIGGILPFLNVLRS
jgi:Zn-dependent protease